VYICAVYKQLFFVLVQQTIKILQILKMTWTKLETCAVFAVIFLFATVSARGSKGHGDECILGLSASIGAGVRL
jgi:hypothetical protein